MSEAREVRLRPEYAHLYPGIPLGWHRAALIADLVADLRIAREGYVALRDRVLPPEHFEYRGALPERAEPRGRLRRLADRMA